MSARQLITRKAVAALLGASAIALLAAPVAIADVTTVGLGGWQVQSTAQATQTPAAISTPGDETAAASSRSLVTRARSTIRPAISST